jgi:hypothetical protein
MLYNNTDSKQDLDSSIIGPWRWLKTNYSELTKLFIRQ